MEYIVTDGCNEDDNAIPVGSACFKKYDDECAELKRVFVRAEYRGQGISKELMNREILRRKSRDSKNI